MAGPRRGHTAAPAVPLPGTVQRMVFIQALMERQWMPETEARQMYRKLAQTADDRGYEELVAEANNSLENVKFGLKRILYSLDNNWYIAFVNKDGDALAKSSGTDYTLPQVHYLRAVLVGLAEADPILPGGMSSKGSNDLLNTMLSMPTQASQGGSQAKLVTIPASEKQTLLLQFVKDGWLANTPNRPGHYSLGPRAFMELGSFLLDQDLPDEPRERWIHFL